MTSAVLLLGLAGSVAAGCAGDAATGPAAGRPHATLALSGAGTVVSVVTRTTPLAGDVTAGAWIGQRGGVIEVPEAGLKVVVPRRAVAQSTYITVRALAGPLVSYEFGPHGTQFDAPLMMTQDMRALDVAKKGGSAMRFEAGHFASAAELSPDAATATVDELLPVTVDVAGNKLKFSVRHFSGYLLASGRDTTTTNTPHAPTGTTTK